MQAANINQNVGIQANELVEDLGMQATRTTHRSTVARQGVMFSESNAKCSIAQGKNTNSSLNHASVAKKDEFYTQYSDIEKEMRYYTASLKSKNILCNCDDPSKSAFFRFFINNFNSLGLNSLSSSYFVGGSVLESTYAGKSTYNAYKAVVREVNDEANVRPDGSIDLKSLFAMDKNKLQPLSGNGDFRSEECLELLLDADIVITNPPFSLFRDYISLLNSCEKKFIVLGNMNATTTKSIFPLFRNNQVWYGKSIRSGDRKFSVPDNYPLLATTCGIDNVGRRFIRVKGVRWFTNLKGSEQSQRLHITRVYNATEYPRYDNYDAIEVSRTMNIPADYRGVMGVPITFLDKYCPDQFEIIMLANGNARTNVSKGVLSSVNYRRHTKDKGGVCIINGKRIYARILIRNKIV